MYFCPPPPTKKKNPENCATGVVTGIKFYSVKDKSISVSEFGTVGRPKPSVFVSIFVRVRHDKKIVHERYVRIVLVKLNTEKNFAITLLRINIPRALFINMQLSGGRMDVIIWPVLKLSDRALVRGYRLGENIKKTKKKNMKNTKACGLTGWFRLVCPWKTWKILHTIRF